MATWTESFDRYVNLIVTATESNVNTSNNTSVVTVTAKLRYHTGSTSTFNNYPQTLTVSINGVSKLGKTNQTYYLTASSREKSLGSWTETITHNNDGSKSININVSYKASNGDGATVNKTMALTTIARASKPYLNKTSITLGSHVEIHFGRADPSFTHSVVFSFGSKTFNLADKTTDGMITWTPTASQQSDIASQIPNKTSGWGSFSVTTYSGTSQIGGVNYVKLTLTIPDNSATAPTITAPTFEERVAIIDTLKTGFIQGKSIIRIRAVASSTWHSTVTRIQFKIGDKYYNGALDGNSAWYDYKPSSFGGVDIRAIVTDSRGRSRESVINRMVVSAYSNPSLSMSVNRKNPPNADKIQVSLISNFTSLNNKNATTLDFRVRPNGGSWSGNLITNKNNSTGSISIATSEAINYTFSTTTAYEVKAVIKDQFSEAVQSISTISTGKALFDAYKDIGISIGKIYDEKNPIELQVAGDAEFDGSLKLTGATQDVRLKVEPVAGNGSIEIGALNVRSTPYIDFRSSGTNNDYDARIISRNGSSANGYGELTFEASELFVGISRTTAVGIVSYGNNTNGHWIRYYDGTQICWGRERRNVDINLANGALFRGAQINYTYPMAFVGAFPHVAISAFDAMTALMQIESRTSFGVMLFKGTTATNLSTQISWQAIGRWKE